jgi:putative PIN family toxin of toxin-antitoxin system
MSRPNGPAGLCFDAVIAGSVELYISRFVLAELADVPSRPEVAAKLKLTPLTTKRFLEVLCSYAHLLETPVAIFSGCRDPDDDLYVNLALSLPNCFVVSRDKDLLDLVRESNPARNALLALRPEFRILTPPGLLAILESQK